MRVLTLDVGNTSVDVCLFDGSLKYVGKHSHKDVPLLSADLVLVSSVKPSANNTILEKYPHARFIGAEDVPLQSAFEGKEKVGIDRLLNLYGAVQLFSKDVVVASFGTAVVLDLAIDGVFQGGFITLGVGTGLECLSQRAELIPKLELKKTIATIGKDAETAILGGFYRQYFHFLEGCLREWQKAYGKSLSLVLTGGDGWLFEELGIYEPLLIHKAMLLLSGFYSKPL